ncbi:hypothetical protein VNI00_011713 [Paramarasmius palmivorus]|uniref:Uncharacterized protein n=1 Tax=Paramarasmius palmivorus TaxID=297713 RepID=A0AAW0CDC2_9AGAR
MSLTNADSICDARHEIKKIQKTNTSSSVETVEEEGSFDDGYTLSAYGDISHSEIYFVPSVPSETCPSPTRQSSTYRRNAKKPPPPGLRKNNLLRMRSKSSEEQNVAQLAQKAAMSQPELDFNTLVATLRQARSNIAKDRPTMPYLKCIEAKARSPRSTRKPIEDKDEEIQVEKAVVKKPGTAQTVPVPSPLKLVNSPTRPDKKANAPSPSPKPPASPKPWRANGLPRRGPLPRWDLMDPDVILEGKNYRLKSCLST